MCGLSGSSLFAASQLSGRVSDPGGLPLPGVMLTLDSPPAAPRTAITDADGAFRFDVPAGRYTLRADLAGFQSVTRSSVNVGADPVVLDLTLQLAAFEERVVVSAEGALPMMGDPQPDAPATVTRELIDNGMLPNSQYDDVLPLLPNVVRGPDGLISVAGARAPQGALLVNGLNDTDPISGEPGVMLPLEAVDSVEVFSAGYPADLGRATGGVTSVHTRSGSDTLHMTASSFFPRLRFINGGLHGIDSWEPNIGASGPVVKGRVFFQTALSYRFDRNRFDTLLGPQDNIFQALLSWSQLDVLASPSQHLTASLAFDPQTTDHANITAFTPSESVPRVGRGGVSGGLADRVTLGTTATVELHANLIHTTRAVEPDGALPYASGHDFTRGSYFDRQDLHGSRVEAGGLWSWNGPHHQLLKIGATAARASLDGSDVSAPVTLLRSDGSPAQMISFANGRPVGASTTEEAVFAQDTWTAGPNITIDGGARFDVTSAAARPAVSPRVAATVKLPADATLTGGIGLFADKLPLEALTFPSAPARAVVSYDQSGAVIADRLFNNVQPEALRMAVATRWYVEFDRRFGAGWLTRVKYQERHGRDEPVVNPIVLSSTTGQLAIASTGSSQARSLEATVGVRAGQGGDEIYVSYVRSAARGDLNAFDAISGVLRDPFVQANQRGPLAADVPHRLLAWSLIHLPARFTAAPFVEVRSGFPYSAITDVWTYTGPRNAYRLPWFGSLDLYVNKIVGLPGHLPDARVGIKLYNVLAAHSERDVQRDIERPDFGTTYNPSPRDFTFVFELLWGKR